jgi:PLP dependent protein
MINDQIANRYHAVLAQLREQEAHFERPAGSVRLLAVSKTHSVSAIREAYQAGARDFGENYVQEAVQKIRLLSATGTDSPDISWHFIGPIQSNKTREIAENFDWVHSVDRSKIAVRLNEQRSTGLKPLNVCVQVNLSKEDSKSGVSIEQTAALCELISQLPRLQLRGLMAIPAPCHDEARQRAAFRPLSQLFESLQPQYPAMDTLSIGMSDDFRAAIAEGSTMIRIGTAIFGARARRDS